MIRKFMESFCPLLLNTRFLSAKCGNGSCCPRPWPLDGEGGAGLLTENRGFPSLPSSLPPQLLFRLSPSLSPFPSRKMWPTRFERTMNYATAREREREREGEGEGESAGRLLILRRRPRRHSWPPPPPPPQSHQIVCLSAYGMLGATPEAA